MMTGRVTRGWTPGEPPRWHEEDDLEFCWGVKRTEPLYWRGHWADLRKKAPCYVYWREPEDLPHEGLPPDVGSWQRCGLGKMDDATAVQVLNGRLVVDVRAAQAKTIKGIFYWRPAAPVTAYKARQGSEPFTRPEDVPAPVEGGWRKGYPVSYPVNESDFEFMWTDTDGDVVYWRGSPEHLPPLPPGGVYWRRPCFLPADGLMPRRGMWRAMHFGRSEPTAGAIEILHANGQRAFIFTEDVRFSDARWKDALWRPKVGAKAPIPDSWWLGSGAMLWPNVEPAPLDPFSLEGIVAAGRWQRLTAKNYQEVQARFGRVELLGLKGGVPTRVIKPTIAPSWDVAPLYWRITDVGVAGGDRPWSQWIKDDFERPSSWEKVEVLAGEPPVIFRLKAGEVETIAAPEGSIWWRYAAEAAAEKPAEPPPAAAVEPDPVTKTSLTVGQKIPTRGGHTAEITETNGPEPFPIGAKINFLDGRVGFVFYPASGRLVTGEVTVDHPLDLILPEQPAEPAPLDLTKPVRTRDGRKVRIVATDVNRWERPILALVTWSEGQENAYYYTAAGRLHSDSETELDLVQDVPEPRKGEAVVWLNVYGDAGWSVGSGRRLSTASIALIRAVIPWTEGVFHEEPEAEG